MATQTLEANATPGLTISGKLFAVGSDTVVATVSGTEKTNDKGRYTFAFTDVPAGTYRLNGFVGANGGYINEVYSLTLATATFYPVDEQVFPSNFASLGINTSGHISRVVLTDTATAVTNGVTVSTNNDKSGYSLTQSFPTNFAALGINASGHISRVTLVDTTTTNTDMRGTDNALLASSYVAPANSDIAAIKAKTDNLPAAFPTNFAALGINASGHISRVVLTDTTTAVTNSVTAGTVSDKTGYSLSGTQTFNLTGNITGNLSGSVGSVTSGVTVSTNNDKTGYALTSGERTSVADAILSRSVATVEATTPEHSLATVVLAMLEWGIASGVLTVYRTDGTTPHLTKAVTSSINAYPVTKVE